MIAQATAVKDCEHPSYHIEETESDPRHPEDNRPETIYLAICDECGEDVTELVGDPKMDGPNDYRSEKAQQ